MRSTSPPLADDTHRTISVDKMTRIQALERIVPGLPMLPGEVERPEFEYRRHGTQTRIATFGKDKYAIDGYGYVQPEVVQRKSGMRPEIQTGIQ